MVRFWNESQRSGYKWAVDIDRDIEHSRWTEVVDWCINTFGPDSNCNTWRQALAGSPSIYELHFSTYLFKNYDDAILFSLAWCFE